MSNDTSERGARRAEAGFTLIEVLVAMIILSIGMMGLEAMGIAAARNNIFARRQSEYAQHATRHIEAAVDSVNRGAITCGTVTWPGENLGDEVRRVIKGDTNEREIAITIKPSGADGVAQPPEYTIKTYVFVPNALAC